MKQSTQQKIYLDVINKIKSQTFKAGDRLISTREASKYYGCHRLTALKAYQDLTYEGWLNSKNRSHYFVSEKAPITESKGGSTKTKFSGFKLTYKPSLNFAFEHNVAKIEFWGGQPDLRLFNKEEFTRSMSTRFKKTNSKFLNYGTFHGLPDCIDEVSQYLRRSRNILNKDILITNGSQEALTLIARTFIKPNQYVAVEEKTYPSAKNLFLNLGAKVISIKIDEEGLDTDDLALKLKKYPIKLLYITPLHQYPTTVTLSPRRRQHLIKLAEQYQLPILEDDYDYEYHYTMLPPAPLATETEYAIYICSFSKILFPGIRLGAIACHSSLTDSLSQQKYLLSRQTDSLSQVALTSWLKEGILEKHVRRMQKTYEKRLLFMEKQLTEIQKTFNITWKKPNGGMSLWVNINKNSKTVAERCLKKGILFQYEEQFSGKAGTHLRIGFACVNEEEIFKGLTVLSSVL